MEAIFKETGRALHFAFMMQAYEGSPESILAVTIKRLIKDLGIWEDQSKKQENRIDFGGLTAAEIAQQCVQIRTSVREQLRPFDAQLVEAKYSTQPATKAAAVHAVADYFRPVIDVSPELARALAWRYYSPPNVREVEYSFRRLVHEHGKAKSSIERIYKRLAHMIGTQESMAVDCLRDRFEKAGIAER